MADAETLWTRALNVLQENYGADSPELADDTLPQLALVCFRRKQWKRAEHYYREAIRIIEKARGADDVELHALYATLSATLICQDRLDDAEQAMLRSLAIIEKNHGPNHPEISNGLANLAAIYYRQDKDEQAERISLKAMAVAEAALGPDHPLVAERLEHHAQLLRELHRSADAHRIESRARAIRAKHAKQDKRTQ